MSCHVGQQDWTMYDNVIREKFKIRKKVLVERSMPPGGMTPAERAIITKWMMQGSRK